MALTTQERTGIHAGLRTIMTDDHAEALLSNYPISEDDELVTRKDLRVGMSELRTEMADLRTDMRTEMADLRTELKTEMADLRTDMRTEMADLRTDVGTELAGLRGEMAGMRGDLCAEIKGMALKVTLGVMASMVGGLGLVAKIVSDAMA